MPPKRVAVVAPVDYHIRTRSASRTLIPVVVTPRVVALIPDSDSESEERPSRRLNFDISPVREEPEQVNVPLNMDPDLAQALANFANGAAQDRAQYQGCHDALMNLLGAQQQESAALRALAGDVEEWTNAEKRQVAVSRLGGIALQWHLHSGANNPNWQNWFNALGTNFTQRLSPSEWYKLIEERVQKARELGIAYAVEKSCLLDLSPHVLTNAQKVSSLIGGLANWQHVAAMMNDTPADVDEFMTRLRNLETLFSTLRPDVSPFPPNNPFFQTSTLPPVPMHPPPVPTPLSPAAPHIDVGSELLSMGNQIAGLTERLNGLTLGGGQRQMQRQPDNRSCFQCGAIGHIKRNCPRGAVNGQASSAGPGQR
ncbi:hypothetical protein OUZ56_018582 [Daphnia magna]|uniref:CCHC-type domain-containing protein n=1 Tax=Daphnia magna TaxID=35525 RepID=A0ABQ9Z989_9CRUS|nr:hypothetical protein OUZ56_018582 [Daphnia magna]